VKTCRATASRLTSLPVSPPTHWASATSTIPNALAAFLTPARLDTIGGKSKFKFKFKFKKGPPDLVWKDGVRHVVVHHNYDYRRTQVGTATTCTSYPHLVSLLASKTSSLPPYVKFCPFPPTPVRTHFARFTSPTFKGV